MMRKGRDSSPTRLCESTDAHTQLSSITVPRQQADDGAVDGAAFQYATWTVFVLQVWLLDFGRPFFSLFLSGNSSLSCLSIS